MWMYDVGMKVYNEENFAKLMNSSFVTFARFSVNFGSHVQLTVLINAVINRCKRM